MDNSLDQATDIVVEAFANTPNLRLREALISLTRHLHDWVREIDPTMDEWNVAIDYLTRTGHMCDDKRQEFMLLSDVFGVTNLVDQLESRHANEGATETTVLGPFHMVESPRRELGAAIMSPKVGDPCWVAGRVLNIDGTPIPGATIDVWQADDQGFYDVQILDEVDVGVGRGLFTADEQGSFYFRTVVPAPYPIPTDGPVGELLMATNRHPNRPAHIHFIAEAQGYHSLTTHMFVEGSDWIEADAVFATKRSLVVPFSWVDDQTSAAEKGLPNPHREARFDIHLARRS
ncbi:dioxygenase [Mycobacterium sp. 236(2023)]|uniref:dioxygenase family protein n=1 Tax=Mycobacterium sp. 236(2023) TaxID=3038163 RepID=UPI002414D75D|nr:dioxygenase [Mycobacterium sp. 236(2023)]MDG4668109.1 dioxygenase [Mycobacterium sp. 236(2023)]